MIAARTMPIALTTEPQSGPKSTPFMMASASGTENGAEATTAMMRMASGIANGPSAPKSCSTSVFRQTTKAASANDAPKMAAASRRLRNTLALVPVTVWLLCGIGVYASARMAHKVWLDRHGRLQEPSVVQTPAARLYFGIPNALLGLVYYPFVAAAFPFAAQPAVRAGLSLAVTAAAISSIVLVVDLAFVRRQDCRNCYLAHAVNLALPVAVATRCLGDFSHLADGDTRVYDA